MADKKDKKPADKKAPPPENKGFWGSLPRWKQGCLILSVFVMILGLGMGVAGGGDDIPARTPDDLAGEASTGPEGARGFAPGAPPIDTTGDPTAQSAELDPDAPVTLDEWSPAVFRFGFSFFVGMAVAHAMRTLLRITLVASGFFILALFGLQYAGYVEPDWTVIQEDFDSFGDWARGQLSSFQQFITGYLPSAAAGISGAVLGFKRR